MVKKSLPYIFLLLLVLVLIFIGGVKYGQKVEETNKVIKFVLSITPTAKPAKPTPTIPLEFKSAEYCGMKFLLPSVATFKPGKDNTADKFSDNNGNLLMWLSCYNPKTDPDSLNNSEFLNMHKPTIESTLSGQFKHLTIQNKVYTAMNDMITIRLVHPRTGYQVIIQIKNNLYPLFEKTLEFVTPVPTKKPAATGIISP